MSMSAISKLSVSRDEVDRVLVDALANFLAAKSSALAKEFVASRPAEPADLAPSASPAWMCDVASGEVLATNDAAAVIGVTTTAAVIYRCRRAAEAGRPIAIYVAGAWLVSLQLLLADIEREDGLPARLSAESRAKKLPKFGSSQKIRLQSA